MYRIVLNYNCIVCTKLYESILQDCQGVDSIHWIALQVVKHPLALVSAESAFPGGWLFCFGTAQLVERKTLKLSGVEQVIRGSSISDKRSRSASFLQFFPIQVSFALRFLRNEKKETDENFFTPESAVWGYVQSQDNASSQSQ